LAPVCRRILARTSLFLRTLTLPLILPLPTAQPEVPSCVLCRRPESYPSFETAFFFLLESQCLVLPSPPLSMKCFFLTRWLRFHHACSDPFGCPCCVAAFFPPLHSQSFSFVPILIPDQSKSCRDAGRFFHFSLSSVPPLPLRLFFTRYFLFYSILGQRSAVCSLFPPFF